MKIAAALAALGLALLTGCAPAEGALSQVEPLTQGENGAQASEERGESSMERERPLHRGHPHRGRAKLD